MIFAILDGLALVTLVLCAGEMLRLQNPSSHPLHAAASLLVAFGAMHELAQNLRGHPVSWCAVALHCGAACYACWFMRAQSAQRRKTDVDAAGRHLRRSA